MQVKLNEQNEKQIRGLARFNHRSPTAECNLAIEDHIRGLKIQANAGRLLLVEDKKEKR